MKLRPLTVEQQNLALANRGITYKVINCYQRKLPHWRDEIESAGLDALVRGARTFDLSFGVKPSTYFAKAAERSIRRTIQHEIARRDRLCYQSALESKLESPDSSVFESRRNDQRAVEDRLDCETILGWLEEDDRRLLIERYFRGRSQLEVTAALGLETRQAVSWREIRALKVIRQRLGLEPGRCRRLPTLRARPAAFCYDVAHATEGPNRGLNAGHSHACRLPGDGESGFTPS